MPRLAPPGRVYGACQPSNWRYHEIPIATTGATCLDGSPYGFYFTDGIPSRREPRSMRYNESWVLFFEGGGWCWSPEDCALRAEQKSGSSTTWQKNSTVSLGGLVNRCCFCTKFCRFRRVYLKSCDGHSFVGNATFDAPTRPDLSASREAVDLHSQMAPPKVLRSAGQAILRGVLDELMAHFGLADAKSILIAGCSAGGLAALLTAERIRTELADRGVRPKRIKVASLAGVFFKPPAEGAQRASSISSSSSSSSYAVVAAASGSVSGSGTASLTPFEEQIRAAVRIGNMAIPSRCADAMPPGEAWRCLFGMSLVEALPVDLPAFVYQSRLDLWQTNCGLAAGRSRYFQYNCSSQAWRGCLGWMAPLSGKSKCADWQWAQLRAFERANHATLTASPALQRVGYGSFLHSCYDHCPSTFALINTGALAKPGAYNDSVNPREALYDWFLQEDKDAVPAWNNTHHGCWNGWVSARLGEKPPPWCRKMECGPYDKMHHEASHAFEKVIRNRGWAWQL